jgi:glycine/D-amino acid oxidase-like deaminating enzyme
MGHVAAALQLNEHGCRRGGGAGASAAIEAAEQGASVVVLERRPGPVEASGAADYRSNAPNASIAVR